MIPRRILIVEDEKEIQNLLAHYLRKEGFHPILATDGEMALSKARKEKPDLILLDILLPQSDGLEVLRAVRSDADIARTPVVMLTAKGDETDRVIGLELGADDYIPKPFSGRTTTSPSRSARGRSSPGSRRSCAAAAPHPPNRRPPCSAITDSGWTWGGTRCRTRANRSP